FAVARPSDLVTVVAMNAAGGDAFHTADVVIVGRVGFGRGGVAGGANAGAGGQLLEQIPAAIRPAVPVGAVVQVAEVAVGRRPGVATGRPFGVGGCMTVTAVQRVDRVGR